MSSDLFRKEVIAARQNDWLGTIRLQPPHLGWSFFGLGLGVTTAILWLLIGSHYTRHEQVDGTLVPSSGLLTVTPAARGIVTRVLVREGDKVHAGQPLVEISGEQDSTALGDTHAAIATQLQFKRSRLRADLKEQQHLTDLQKQDLHLRLTLLRGQIVQMDQQIALQKQRAASALALFEQWSKLGNNGVVSKLQLLQQHDTALQNLAQLKQLNGQSFQLRQQSEELQGQLDQLPATTSSKRNDTERQLSDVAQSLAQNAAQRAVLLRASTDGTVANVLIHPGQAVTAQQSLMTVLPAKSVLLAELWVPTKAVGFITPGERVLIRYQAYPYQKFGQHFGRVSDVSRSAVSPADLGRLLGQEIKEPRYRVQVALDSQSVLAYGRLETLKPGMTLDADVLLDQRRLIEWVFEPLYGFTRSLGGNAAMPEAAQ
jgi:membrane fusion protein